LDDSAIADAGWSRAKIVAQSKEGWKEGSEKEATTTIETRLLLSNILTQEQHLSSLTQQERQYGTRASAEQHRLLWLRGVTVCLPSPALPCVSQHPICYMCKYSSHHPSSRFLATDQCARLNLSSSHGQISTLWASNTAAYPCSP